MNLLHKCLLLVACGCLTASCSTYDGGERKKHELKRPDGAIVYCLEPPPEVVKKGSINTDIGATVTSVGLSMKAVVRGEETPERIRDKLPKNLEAYQRVKFELCMDYGNGLYSPEEYRAFNNVKMSDLLPAKDSPGTKSPLKEGVSADAVRHSLIQFIEEAHPILRELDKASTNVSEDSKRNERRWYAKVKAFLEANFTDPIYARRFKYISDVPLPAPPSLPAFNDEYTEIRGSIVTRQARLNQFLDKLP